MYSQCDKQRLAWTMKTRTARRWTSTLGTLRPVSSHPCRPKYARLTIACAHPARRRRQVAFGRQHEPLSSPIFQSFATALTTCLEMVTRAAAMPGEGFALSKSLQVRFAASRAAYSARCSHCL